MTEEEILQSVKNQIAEIKYWEECIARKKLEKEIPDKYINFEWLTVEEVIEKYGYMLTEEQIEKLKVTKK